MSESVVPGAGLMEERCFCACAAAKPRIAYVMSVNHVTDMVGVISHMDKDSVVLRRPAMVDYGVEGFHLTGSIIPFESVQLDHEDVLVTLPMYTVVYVVTFDEDEQHPVVKKYHEYLAGVTGE